MATEEVLVIGAAGKTGRAVARALTDRGVTVRAAVRPGSTSPVPTGALVRPVPIDLLTGSGLEAAIDGVDAIYHLAPNVHPDEVAIADRVASVAAAQGVSRFAFHSVLHPDDASMPHHVRKAEAERVVRSHVPTATVLRPAAYHQNLTGAAQAGRIKVPYSLDAPFTNVDLSDVAEVGALVLTDPTDDAHAGLTHELVGAESLSVRDQARIAADVLGRPVDAVQIPLQGWVDGPGAGLPDGARADLVAMFTAYDRVGLVGDASALRALLGREPRSWSDALVDAQA